MDPDKIPQKFLRSEIPGNGTDCRRNWPDDLGMDPKMTARVYWQEDGKTRYRIYIACNGCLSHWVDVFHQGEAVNIILCPELRFDLIFFKIDRDPRLLEALGSWRLIGFEQIRRIAVNPDPQWAFRDAMSDPGKTPDGKPRKFLFFPERRSGSETGFWGRPLRWAPAWLWRSEFGIERRRGVTVGVWGGGSGY